MEVTKQQETWNKTKGITSVKTAPVIPKILFKT